MSRKNFGNSKRDNYLNAKDIEKNEAEEKGSSIIKKITYHRGLSLISLISNQKHQVMTSVT